MSKLLTPTILGQLMGFRQEANIFTREGNSYSIPGGTKIGTPAHTISAAVTKAGFLYVGAKQNNGISILKRGDDDTQSCAIIDSTDFTCAEIKTGDETFDLCIYNKKTGSVQAGTLDRSTGEIEEFIVSPGKRCGTVILLATLPRLEKSNPKVSSYLSSLENTEEAFNESINFETVNLDAKSNLANFCDEIYFLFKDGKAKLNIPDTGKTKKITKGSLESGAYVESDAVVIGIPEVFVSVKKDTLTTDISSLMSKFKNKRTYTDSEKTLIPVLDEKKPISKEAIEIAEDFYKSKHSLFSFLLIGEPGSGKSTAAEQVAGLLQVPFVRFLCGPDMTALELLQQLMPNTNPLSTIEYPSVEEIRLDPEGSYKKITGEDSMPDGMETDDIINLLLFEIQNQKANDFIVIDSPILMAAKNGYMVEVQECNLPKPAELEALNMLLEERSLFLSTTGEKIEVHPDFGIIFTMNKDLQGTRPMNQAIFDRCQEKFIIHTPDVDEATKRVMSKTGCTSEAFVRQCVEIQESISDYLKKNYITDGACGIRSVMNWVMKTMQCDDPISAAWRTIVTGATLDEEVQNTLFSQYICDIRFPEWKTDEMDLAV